MKDLKDKGVVVLLVSMILTLGVSLSESLCASIRDGLFKKETVSAKRKYNPPNRGFIKEITQEGYIHKREKRWLNGKPAIVNTLIINPDKSNAIIKPSNASYFINSIKSVREIAHSEAAFAGINASYFKPDCGAPLGTSIVEGKVITGPLYKRVTIGITKDKKLKMDRINIGGSINIGNRTHLKLFNINQPVFSRIGFTIFTDKWGKRTPKTKPFYSHIVVAEGRVKYIKNSSVAIPYGGYVIVGPHSIVPKNIEKNDIVSYSTKLSPNDWNEVETAIGGGPYLIKNGKIFIDQENFSSKFLWDKAPRTAIGYTRSGVIIMVTVDGRRKGFSEGATLPELAHILYDLGAYNAMNLDGGSSTQMVINGKLVNYPTVKGGSRVTNALVIISPVFAAQ